MGDDVITLERTGEKASFVGNSKSKSVISSQMSIRQYQNQQPHAEMKKGTEFSSKPGLLANSASEPQLLTDRIKKTKVH